MEIKFNSQREVELFYIGMLMGNYLDVDSEWQTIDSMGFGDFEGLCLQLCKKTLNLEFGHTEGRDKYYATIGIVHDAEREIREWLK
jgi:hypothetical protein